MKRQQELLLAWHSRIGHCDSEKFSKQARQCIATVFLELASLKGIPKTGSSHHIDLNEWSTQLAELGSDNGLSAPVFCAELRDCQLSLFGMFMSSAIEAGPQQTAVEQNGVLQSMAILLDSLNELITQSAMKFVEIGNTPGVSTISTDNHGRKAKTLQHEIRTPLQGALLTTELMLEDAGHGDPVSVDDILAVRKSIETAVGILNHFASHASPE